MPKYCKGLIGQVCVTSGLCHIMMVSCDFEKYLLICTSECMSIGDISICQSHVTK